MRRAGVVLIVVVWGSVWSAAQPSGCAPESGLCPTRFWAGNAVVVAADVAVMTALSRLWYSDYERTRFHWHDDFDNWAQQDKLGHLAASWHLARAFGAFGRWSGLSRRRAGLYGGLMSFAFESQIEVLDGFSEGWGASWADIAFNAAGAAMGGMQAAYPELEVVTLKFSYHRSPYYDEGASLAGNLLKDYDGQSYWLVVRPADLGVSGWPRWLGLTVGAGADGLARALPTPEQPHRREWYVGPDLDLLRAVAWPRPWMRTAAEVLSFVRLPAPALQLAPGVRVHAFYY